jgi:hypothetical protein
MSIASWLKEPITAEEFEREYAAELAMPAERPASFACQWQLLLAKMQSGDSLRKWSRPPKQWKRGEGWGGVARS